jgi:hypothetical protein
MSGTYEERKKREAVAERAAAERRTASQIEKAYAQGLKDATVGKGRHIPGTGTYYGGRRRKTKSKTKRSRTKRSTKSKRTRSRK